MTVQELMNELSKIEDKNQVVTIYSECHPTGLCDFHYISIDKEPYFLLKENRWEYNKPSVFLNFVSHEDEK